MSLPRQPLLKLKALTVSLALAAMSGRAAEFNVADHGAKGDGKTLCTLAIQKAIDAAADSGGVVTFPKGTFVSGSIFLKSGVELRLDEGVVLQAVPDDAAYPEIWTRIAGIEMLWPAALINVNTQHNVKITGKGMVDGNGEYWWKKFKTMRLDYEKRGLRWAVDYDCKRVRPIVIYESKDIEVRDITIRRSGFWTLTMTYSEHCVVDGVTIRDNTGPSSDGIDVDSSRDVLIQNCDVDCNDDNFCLKAGRDADGLRVNRPTENVVIRNCISRRGDGMFTIGSETSGGIRNVEVANIKALGTSTGIRLKSARTRGGVVENIHIHDVQMDQVANPFEFELNWYPAYSYATIPKHLKDSDIPAHWKVLAQRVKPVERGIPEFRDISISNITVRGAQQALQVNGWPEKPIRNVRWESVSIQARSAGIIQHAANWTMTNVVLQTKDGRPIKLINCLNVATP